MPRRILGLSAYYHDSAACLVVDGEIVAAAQEERFTRKKHDPAFPSQAVAYCLRQAGVTVADLDLVGFYEKPLVKFERLLETYTAYAPRGIRSYLKALPLWLGEKLWMADAIQTELGYDGDVRFGEHHGSHAASAFYPSPFEDAAIVTMDGVGEWATSSIGAGRGAAIEMLREQRFPHSLGLLYSAFTYFAGFRVNSGEYKVMGLAPYGEPKYVAAIKDRLIEIGDDGSLWMNPDYFEYAQGLTMTGRAFEDVFGGPARAPESLLTQREMDLARSIQDITEEVMLKMVRFAGPLPADKAPHLGPNGKMVAPNGHELIRVRIDDGKGGIVGQSQYALVDPQTNEFYVQNNAGGFLHPTTYNGPLSLPPNARFEGAPFSPAELHNFEQIANGKQPPPTHLPLPKPPLVPGLPTFPFPQLPGLNRFKLTLERHLKAGDLEFSHTAPKPGDIRSQTVIKTEHPYTYTAVVLKSDPTHVIIKRELTGGIVMSKPGSETYSQPISITPYFFD